MMNFAVVDEVETDRIAEYMRVVLVGFELDVADVVDVGYDISPSNI